MADILPPRPTRPTYGPPPRIGVQPEADGFTATCACLWLRWWPDRKAAATEYAKHVKSCKSHRVEAAA